MSVNSFRINGGKSLKGEVVPQGSKNEALQIVSTVLLTTKPVTIKNIPEIEDIHKQIQILKGLGVKVTYHSKGHYTFQADDIDIDFLETEDYFSLCGSLRGSIMIAGPILSRFKKCYVYQPGGDKIGRRKIDVHVKGLLSLGANYTYEDEKRGFKFFTEGLRGCYMHLDEPSVTGTANILMASVLAEGKTVIYNAACEPYIQQTCKILKKMGAKISGIGSNLLTIEGVDSLQGAEHEILPDMIEIGSWVALAAMTKSDVLIKNVSYDNLGVIPDYFSKLGININLKGDNIHIMPQDLYEIKTNLDGSIITISDSPWPGFTPDLISVLLVLATQASGSVVIHQKMFESRLFFVDQLIEMGAKIILCDPHRATVIGLERKTPLRAKVIDSPDIRAGISLLIAALSAEGTSFINNVYQIDRGYENIDKRLINLGADIERIK